METSKTSRHTIGGISISIGTKLDVREYESVLIILQKDANWLLVKNQQRGWEFPGGHVESGENYEDTARREAREEAGATITDIRYVGNYSLPSGHTTVITTARVTKIDALTGLFETSEIGYFAKLPTDLSFKDGLYQFILEQITK